MNPDQNKKKGGARLAKDATPPAAETEPRAAGGAKPPKTKKPKKKRTPKQQALFVGYIIVMVLAGLIVAVGIFLAVFIQKPEQVQQTGRPTKEPVSPTASVDPTGEPVDEPSGDRKEDFYTFLLVGRDTYGGGNTDTMMLCSYDIPNQKVSVMSIPRDTMVNVSWDIKRINSVYNMYGGGEDGMDALKAEIAELVGFQPDYTFVVEWEAVGEIVDAVGGVSFDVPRRMYYNDLTQHFKIDLQKGYQKLNGSQAMQLLRYRHDSDDNGNILNSGYPDGDLGRIKVQQSFLKAMLEQCLSSLTAEGPIKGLETIKNLAQVFFDNVTTELTVGNMAYFAQQAVFGSGGALSMENVTFVTMPNEGKYVPTKKYGRQSYVVPVVDELVEVVNTHFNPYKEDLRKSELDIMFVNKDGTLGCTGGVLQDTGYNKWILGGGGSSKPSSSPEPSQSTEPSTSPAPSDSPSAPPSASPSDQPSASPSAPPSPSASPSDNPAPSPSESLPPEPTPSESLPPEESPSPTPGESQPPAESPSPAPEPDPGIPEGIPVFTPGL
ncbi:transcriptional regulator [Pseudoflavonifractor sp. BIOML-A6]|nr:MULTISPECIES: LCP family protein [unclassified Pseudoflavonifractor]MTQ95759.1 transcriptional regulator [Pseudoflavonifractor sp. BIOML-A16]MTR05736.1 transcriptional regulator [Pseudoflavonifractor sp. BIOML-A15]MTR31983.1 transcriptional regulator [Pseudoflavonifractor sp. BIOML-A14]MTR73183.1 transcriptional regulator [Pseudoflavonifractor sp. BIOML-A18]MTS65348.1 transcriptional regulator [Pseudoflavonifractor sp. BIOML-A5]MTS71212.1 transcriptional regulator [Pseudoflavonifractor sp.